MTCFLCFKEKAIRPFFHGRNHISSIKPEAYIKNQSQNSIHRSRNKGTGMKCFNWYFLFLLGGGRGEATTFFHWLYHVGECNELVFMLFRTPSSDPYLEQHIIYLFALLSTFKYIWSSLYVWLCKSIEPGLYKYCETCIGNLFQYLNIICTFICILFVNVLVTLWYNLFFFNSETP